MFRATSFMAWLAVLLGAAAAAADTGVPFVGSIEFLPGAEPTLMLVPDGSGPAWTQARAADGSVVDATIRVTVVDLYGSPIWSFPWQDVWLDAPDWPTPLGGCLTISPDANSDVNGVFEFTLPPRHGGWTEGPLTVYLNGIAAANPFGAVFPPLPLRINSPDLNNDGVVDLSDVVLFSQDYFGAYAFRSDLLWDGVLNLSDVTLLAAHLGAACD